MDNFSYYVGLTDDFVTFLGVTPRPATPDEARGYDGIINVYEVKIDEDQMLKAIHHQLVEGGDEDISVEMLNKGRVIFSQSMNCVQIIVDKMDSGKAFLVLREGSTNLYIHKDPWSLSVDNSNFYEDTSDDY